MNRRRMKGGGPAAGAAHSAEHYENAHCAADPACKPLDVVEVPSTGTHLVVNGEVLEGSIIGGAGVNEYSTLTIALKPAKPDFFRAGKKYTRHVGYSVQAKASDVIERFECVRIEKNGDGTRVALGRLTVATSPTNRGVDEWMLRSDYAYGDWEEVT